MNLTPDTPVLVTGATGFVGGHVAERCRSLGIPAKTLARETSDRSLLNELGVEVVTGDLQSAEAVSEAVKDVAVIVHCAAKVGDWGPVDDYRAVNVTGIENLISAARSNGRLERFVHVSSLGVYEARDHYGTDESEPVNLSGIDGYTTTKAESEQIVRQSVEKQNFPAVILRPGFIYGPRDRTVLPRIVDRLKDGKFKFLGSGEQLLNNTYVGNLVDAIFLAIEKDVLGEAFNITDGRLVTKRQFATTVAQLAGLPVPTKSVPLPVAKSVARMLEGVYRAVNAKHAPLPSMATVKFLGLNLDFSVEKARRMLGYDPQISFEEGIGRTVDWMRESGMLAIEARSS